MPGKSSGLNVLSTSEPEFSFFRPFLNVFSHSSKRPIVPHDCSRCSQFFQPWNCSITEVTVSAINLQFFNHLKCLDLIFIYLSGLMIFIGNMRLLKYASVVDKQVKSAIKRSPDPWPLVIGIYLLLGVWHLVLYSMYFLTASSPLCRCSSSCGSMV